MYYKSVPRLASHALLANVVVNIYLKNSNFVVVVVGKVKGKVARAGSSAGPFLLGLLAMLSFVSGRQASVAVCH